MNGKGHLYITTVGLGQSKFGNRHTMTIFSLQSSSLCLRFLFKDRLSYFFSFEYFDPYDNYAACWVTLISNTVSVKDWLSYHTDTTQKPFSYCIIFYMVSEKNDHWIPIVRGPAGHTSHI